MDAPLVDEEQFPRTDIDIRVIREARNKVYCILYLTIIYDLFKA